MSIPQGWKVIGIVVVLVVTVARPTCLIAPAHADDLVEARDLEIRELVGFLKTKGYYALRDPKEKEAIAKLQKMSEHAAPAVAGMLAEGLKNRKDGGGWIEVYRPLFLLEGMGEHAKVALADITKALEDNHPINVAEAARVLERIGPPAKDALPSLQRVWESSGKDSAKMAASAIRTIDPKTADKLGIN
jgi:HEAT repeat protein